MVEQENRRRSERASYETEVTVSQKGGQTVRGRVRDLSLTGIYIACENPLAEGTLCKVELHASGRASWAELTGSGRVTRREEGGMAVEFTAISKDAYMILRCIVMQNLGVLDEVVETLWWLEAERAA
jgi:hypothetical protein